MLAYDRAWFEPPAPLAYVMVRSLEGHTAVPKVSMLMDSGADVTLLPAGVLESLGVTAIPGKL